MKESTRIELRKEENKQAAKKRLTRKEMHDREWDVTHTINTTDYITVQEDEPTFF